MPTEAEIAWAAGIFEGEGTVTHSKSDNGRVASVTMTDEDVVRRFQQVVGMGVVRGPYHPDPPRKPYWRWWCSSHATVSRLRDMFSPWLGQRRLEQFARALAQPPATYPRSPDCGRYTEVVPNQAGKAAHLRRGEPPCEMCVKCATAYCAQHRKGKAIHGAISSPSKHK